jgi:hypothetical protein
MEARDLMTRATAALAAAALAALLAAGLTAAAAADPAPQTPSQVEAAYLRNFARYVTWPDGAFREPHAPWQIGVLGRDRFGDVLEQTLRGRSEQDRLFEVRRAHSVEALRDCQIVFVGYDDAPRRRAALAELRGRPVLTVGDADGFLEEGGIVQFVVRDTVQMSINLDPARAGALKIQTKMLEVSVAVVENGVSRVQR